MTVEIENPPLVSVIMIFHNERRFLADAVASVTAQSGVSWELVLVDDGSTDGTGNLACELASADPSRIRLVTHPDRANRGMSASRNLGIELARGRWITFLDADDVWLPDKLRHQLEQLRLCPEVKVLVSPAEWWWSWDIDTDRNDWRQVLSSGPAENSSSESRLVSPPRLANDFLVDEWQSICDLVVHRDAVREVGGYEAAFKGMFEDQVFHTKVLSRFPVLVTGRHWYRYRQHRDACTAVSHAVGGHLQARNRFLQWAVDYLHHRPPPESSACEEWSAFVDEIKRQRRLNRRAVVRNRLAGGGPGALRRSWLARR